MYTYEQRKRAVELYIKFGFAHGAVIQGILQASNQSGIGIKSTRRRGELHQEYSSPNRYSIEQKEAAVKHYIEHGRCLSRTVRMLGYPSRQLLREWIKAIAPDTC